MYNNRHSLFFYWFIRTKFDYFIRYYNIKLISLNELIEFKEDVCNMALTIENWLLNLSHPTLSTINRKTN